MKKYQINSQSIFGTVEKKEFMLWAVFKTVTGDSKSTI